MHTCQTTSSNGAHRPTESVEQTNAFNRSVKIGFTVTCLTAAVAVPVILGLGLLLAVELPIIFTAEVAALVASIALGIFVALLLFSRKGNASEDRLRDQQQQSTDVDEVSSSRISNQSGVSSAGEDTGVGAKQSSPSPTSDRNSTSALNGEGDIPPPPPPPPPPSAASQKSELKGNTGLPRKANDGDGEFNPYTIFRKCCIQVAKNREGDKID